MIKVSEIKRVEVDSYIETLRDISIGTDRTYHLVGTVYTGFHNAKTRLSKQGCQFEFERFTNDNHYYIKVKRTK
jgi:hypothetical protein